jgi:histidyl-tRNA synthetase
VVKFSTPTGTQDILPDDWPYWNFLMRHIEEVTQLYGYRRIETPTFAETSLFARTSGEGSDIVSKEMYNFRDRGGDELTLRPEGTAPVVRAYLQHGMYKLTQPVKLYYVERMYRAEAPQAGRYREHHQFGCEAIGVEDAFVDVEMIALLHQFFQRIGLQDLSLHINSIGDSNCRPEYVRVLVEYFRSHEDSLDQLDRDRLRRNPLRVLDSKQARSQQIIRKAPRALDYLCDACRQHWDKLRRGLDDLDIGYEVDNRLVRGLDYYTRTVFEFMPPGEGSQSTVGAGGRYDGLSEAMGGPPVPGVGFGSGLERMVLELRQRGAEIPQPCSPLVYVVRAGEDTEDAALRLAGRLRAADLPVEMAFGESSMNAQMKRANRSGARYALIMGEDELASGEVTLRDLRAAEQRRVSLDAAVQLVSDNRSER